MKNWDASPKKIEIEKTFSQETRQLSRQNPNFSSNQRELFLAKDLR